MAWVNTITRASAVGKLPVSALQIQLGLVPKSAAEMCDSTAWSVLAPHPTAVFRSGSELCWPAACASSPPVSAGLPYPATRRLRRLGSSLRTCLHLKREKAARIGMKMNRYFKFYVCVQGASMPYLNGMTCGVHAEAERFVERRFAIMTTHSGLLLDDSFLSSHIHHIEFHIQVCNRTSTVSAEQSMLISLLWSGHL